MYLAALAILKNSKNEVRAKKFKKWNVLKKISQKTATFHMEIKT